MGQSLVELELNVARQGSSLPSADSAHVYPEEGDLMRELVLGERESVAGGPADIVIYKAGAGGGVRTGEQNEELKRQREAAYAMAFMVR